jgi:hypothetical protein
MTDTAFHKLTTMWQAGELNDDEFWRAAKYLREEHSKAADATKGRPPRNDDSGTSGIERSAKELRLRRSIGTTIVVIFVAAIAVGIGYELLRSIHFENVSKIKPVGPALWTLILLGSIGLLAGYSKGFFVKAGVPLFFVLLVAPLWKSHEHGGGSVQVHVTPAYERHIRAADYGADWPFPDYSEGTLRCGRRTAFGATRPVVTVEFAGRVYGLNGAAIGWGGYADGRALMARHPEWGTYQLGATSMMIADAMARCE